MILGTKMISKWVKTSMKQFMDFWIYPGRALGSQNSSQRPTVGLSSVHGGKGRGIDPAQMEEGFWKKGFGQRCP